MKDSKELVTGFDKTMQGLSGNYYRCPMRCEGDKMYDKPGNCPVCNMKLVLVDNQTHGHGHQ